MEELELKKIIAKNLVTYRKQAHLTQAELAEKLNYSDKNVSKWERAEGVPDVLVLCQLAELYGVTVNDFLVEHTEDEPQKVEKTTKSFWAKRWLITLLSAGLVFLVATVITVIWLLVEPNTPFPIATFVYLTALPIAILVVLVFSCIWGKLWQRCLTVSALVWTLCVIIQLALGLALSNAWLIYLVGAVLQVLVVLWYILVFLRKKGKNNSKNNVE